jgi:hypothetical protein
MRRVRAFDVPPSTNIWNPFRFHCGQPCVSFTRVYFPCPRIVGPFTPRGDFDSRNSAAICQTSPTLARSSEPRNKSLKDPLRAFRFPAVSPTKTVWHRCSLLVCSAPVLQDFLLAILVHDWPAPRLMQRNSRLLLSAEVHLVLVPFNSVLTAKDRQWRTLSC